MLMVMRLKEWNGMGSLWGAVYGGGVLDGMCVPQCLYSWVYRAKMRHQVLLKDEAITARLVHCCCEPCDLCQEYRELQHRGFDMVIGWHGNVEQRKRKLALTTATAPAVEPAMTR